MTTSQAAEHAELIPGRWYWVCVGESGWFPAVHSPTCAGGWTNKDTWEDFMGEVSQWCLIPLPSNCDDRITDVRITRGKARYRLPWWQRWLMPWRWFRAWRKPSAPFPSTTDAP